jgi:hypothetical protein
MGIERTYSTNRQGIVKAYVEVLKGIDGTGEYLTNLDSRVEPRLKFWDETHQFPAVHINAGSETRDYQSGGYKDRFLTLTFRCYVEEENAVDALDRLLEDVETALEENSSVSYTDKRGAIQCTHQITIIQIDTDEGVFEPVGVGEISTEVRY